MHVWLFHVVKWQTGSSGLKASTGVQDHGQSPCSHSTCHVVASFVWDMTVAGTNQTPVTSEAKLHSNSLHKQTVHSAGGHSVANFPMLTYLINFLAKLPDGPQRSEVQVFDDHLPLLRPRLLLDVPGCLLGALPVPTGHDDPGTELQQLPGQGLPNPAVSPGHDDRLSSHGVGWIPEQLHSFLPREQPAHKEQHPAADYSGYEHRSGHERGDRRQVTEDGLCCVSKLQN